MTGRVFLFGAAMALLAVGFTLTDRLIDRMPGVTAANVRRIKPGMTPAQVDALLGRYGSYDEGDIVRGGRVRHWWQHDHGSATVRFGRNGLVEEAKFTPWASVWREEGMSRAVRGLGRWLRRR